MVLVYLLHQRLALVHRGDSWIADGEKKDVLFGPRHDQIYVDGIGMHGFGFERAYIRAAWLPLIDLPGPDIHLAQRDLCLTPPQPLTPPEPDTHNPRPRGAWM